MENFEYLLDLLIEYHSLFSPFIWVWSIFVGLIGFVLGMYFLLGIDALCIKFNNWKKVRKELKNKEKEV